MCDVGEDQVENKHLAKEILMGVLDKVGPKLFGGDPPDAETVAGQVAVMYRIIYRAVKWPD